MNAVQVYAILTETDVYFLCSAVSSERKRLTRVSCRLCEKKRKVSIYETLLFKAELAPNICPPQKYCRNIVTEA